MKADRASLSKRDGSSEYVFVGDGCRRWTPALISNAAAVLHALSGGALADPLLSFPDGRVLTLPPFDSANRTVRSPRQSFRCQVAPWHRDN